MTKTTIIVKTKTRESLKRAGTKGQTYDEVINQLLELKRQDSPERTFATLKSSEVDAV